jgi:hypothetical protein
MTVPTSGSARPSAAEPQLQRWLGLANAASAALAILFIIGAITGIAILREDALIGALLAVAYLIAATLALRVWLIGRHARTTATGDTPDSDAVVSAHRAASKVARRISGFALLIVVAGVVYSIVTGDAGHTLLAILCALPILSLASLARRLTRRLRRLTGVASPRRSVTR